MKYLLPLALLAGLLLLAACAKHKAADPAPADPESAEAEWIVAADTTLTDERRALFEKATDGLLGAKHTPVAYLGSRTDEGTNHCFLCRSAAADGSERSGAYTAAYLYEDPSGCVSVLSFTDIVGGAAEGMVGAWKPAEDWTVTEERRAVLDQALEEAGMDAEPVAYLASQIVAGINHAFFVKTGSSLAVVKVWQKLSGGAELTETEVFDLAGHSAYGG